LDGFTGVYDGRIEGGGYGGEIAIAGCIVVVGSECESRTRVGVVTGQAARLGDGKTGDERAAGLAVD
jgi:hypothetical protein